MNNLTAPLEQTSMDVHSRHMYLQLAYFDQGVVYAISVLHDGTGQHASSFSHTFSDICSPFYLHYFIPLPLIQCRKLHGSNRSKKPPPNTLEWHAAATDEQQRNARTLQSHSPGDEKAIP